MGVMHIVSTWAAVVGAAVVGATVAIGAQAVSQPPAQPQAPGAPPAYEEQLVRVEGCLRRERAPGDTALQVSADPERDVMFVLANASPRSRTDTRPTGDTAPADPALGPAGLQNERAGLEGEGPAAGTPDREQDVRGAAIEGTPTPTADTYVVVGLEDDRLKLFAGQRVEMDGQFDPPAASITRREAEPAAVGTSGTAGGAVTFPRFRATSVKPVPGICTPKP